MKKIYSCILIFVFCFSLGYSNVFAAAETLGDLRAELNSLRRQKSDNQAKKYQTQSQINNQKNNIADCDAATKKAEEDIEVAKQMIEKSNNDIAKLKEESKKLLVFYQQISSDESLLSYVSDASSVTEMIMRINAISQLIEYNKDKLNSLEKKIVDNENLQVSLTKKENELKIKKAEYEESLVSLNDNLASLSSIALDIDEQIAAQNDLIKYYEKIGCKDNQSLKECVAIANSSRFLKPTTKGYISSVYGYRKIISGVTKTTFHSGHDIAGNPGGTPVYSTASGTVAATIYHSSCGGNQVFIHARVKNQAYTMLFAHLMSINVKVGDQVTTDTVIGTVGGGGSTLKKNGGWDTCSTGYHLHYSVANGFYLGYGAEGYSSYSTFVSRLITPPGMPGYGTWYYSRF